MGTAHDQPPNGFLRSFVVLQGAFLILLLIASINEPRSPYNPAPPATQMAVVAALWLVTDVAAVAVHARHLVRARAQRAGR
ncbi:hypothetical protein [Intrasporangium calvum]|uniref:hypothetical protein n=1 Tax=Intrasporangium calvum TaxID=53358 RepID=UPI000308878A|nr:hypothetical protein [Intrasporangium calvum]AXG12462.1 hypothetical protein DN585_02570 [Intrasporangium calvum]